MRKATFMAFIAGAAVGVAATWQYAKKKYEQIAQEEIDSVKAKFANKAKYEGPADSEEEARVKAEMAREKPDVMAYAAALRKMGYTDYSTVGDKKPEEKVDRPYVISPDEFGENEDYERISLTYYADQILADDDDNIVDNVEELVGFESLTHFGEYEDDSVFVRNDRLKCDYEILLDQGLYSDVLKKKPYKAEV